MTTYRYTALCLLLTLCAASASTTTTPDSVIAPTDFLRGHDERMRAVVLRDTSVALSEVEREQVRGMINEAFDFTELSRQSLGEVWDVRTDAERSEFVSVNRGIIERSNLDLFVRYYRGGGITYVGEEIGEDGRAVVHGQVNVKGEAKAISYALHRPDGGDWRIYDLTVDGAGTVDGNRRVWTRYIKRHSYEKLLERLRKKLASLEASS